MSKRSYTLVDQDAIDAQEQVAGLTWPDGSPVRMGDFGQRLKISGLLLQGEGVNLVLLGPNGDPGAIYEKPDGQWYRAPRGNVGLVCVDLETWCKVILQTDDPVYFERNEQGMIKAVHRKVRAQISGGVQWTVWERDGFRCMFCGKKGGSGTPLTVDHYRPLELSGSSDMSNLISSCRRCQKLKGSQDPAVWAKANGIDHDGIVLYLAGKAPASFIAHLS